MDKGSFLGRSIKGWWKHIALITLGVIGVSLIGTGMKQNVKAETTSNVGISFKEEIAKVNTLNDVNNLTLKVYGNNEWAGFARRLLNYENRMEFHNTYINEVKAGDNSDFPLTAFRSSGKHNVGNLTDVNSKRVFSIEYVAEENGQLTISYDTLNVIALGDIWNPNVTYNGKLGISVTKNDVDNIITPTTPGWEYYEAGNTYTLEEDVIDVQKGDKVYLNFRSERLDSSVAASYVVFELNPVFTFEKEDPWAKAFTMLGASVRTNEPSGLGFGSSIDKAFYDNLVLEYGEENIKTGTLITKSEFLTKDTDLVFNHNKALVVENIGWRANSPEGQYTYRGSIVGLPMDQYTTNFTGRGYISITSNGITEYYYTAPVQRNIKDVATSALQNPLEQFTKEEKSTLEKFAK